MPGMHSGAHECILRAALLDAIMQRDVSGQQRPICAAIPIQIGLCCPDTSNGRTCRAGLTGPRAPTGRPRPKRHRPPCIEGCPHHRTRQSGTVQWRSSTPLWNASGTSLERRSLESGGPAGHPGAPLRVSSVQPSRRVARDPDVGGSIHPPKTRTQPNFQFGRKKNC